MKKKKDYAKDLIRQANKAGLSADETQWLQKNSFCWTGSRWLGSILNASQADEAMITAISKRAHIHAINLVEPPDEPEF